MNITYLSWWFVECHVLSLTQKEIKYLKFLKSPIESENETKKVIFVYI